MKKVVTIIATTAMVMSLFTGTVFATPGNGNGHGNGNAYGNKFSDISNHWAEKAIQDLEDSDILEGFGDGTFRPNQKLTEAQFAVILERIKELKSNNDEDNDDEDVAELEDDEDLAGVPGWAKHAVKKGMDEGYLNPKRFHSEKQCDRLYACVALAEALDLDPVYKTDDDVEYKNIFKDSGLFTDYEYAMMVALYEEGYIKGYPDGTFNPYALLNRAQIASIIANILDKEEAPDPDDETAPKWDDDSYITASAISSTHVTLEWDGADKSAVQYKVTYKLDGENKVVYTTAKEITVKGLDPDTEYKFTVEARDVNKNWSEDGPDVKVTTLETGEIADPTWPNDAEIEFDATTEGSITLKWTEAIVDDSVDLDKYVVRIYEDGDFFKSMDSADNDLTVTDLDDNTEYTFKIRAYDEEGNRSDILEDDFETDWND